MVAGGGFPSLKAQPPQCSGPSARVKRVRSEVGKKQCEGTICPVGASLRIRNPRELFPVRDDFIRSAWVQRARTKRAQEFEELYPYFSSTDTTAVVRGTPRADDKATSRAWVSAESTTHTAQAVSQPAVEPNSFDASITPSNDTRKVLSHTKSHHMGVGTGPAKVAELRRAFRRLEPEKMFRAPRAEGEPVWAYWGGGDCQGQGQTPPLRAGNRGITQEGFVLVPAKELAEVRALEGTLRRERDLLKAHCLLALNDGEVSAHRPLEATRMAVHDACGREMSGALRKYRAWTAQNSRNDAKRTAVHTNFGSRSVHKSESHNTDNFRGVCRAATATTAGLGKRTREAASKGRVEELQRTPVGWRTLRWLIARRQDELRSQAAEGEAMHREEMEQLHKERYTEAWERQHDYDLYCVLAGQFWPLEAEAFRAVDRPGKKLYLELDAPARKIIRMWKNCWPCRKDRKVKGCGMFQASWRGHRVRRRWRPIICLRLKHGRRACVRPPFAFWARTTRVHKWARRRFDEMQGRWIRSCFDAWADFTADRATEKLRKLARAGRTLKNIAAYRSFRSWQGYTRASRRARLLFARAVGGPALGAWVRYMDTTRGDRRRTRAAVVIERHARGLLARIRYRAKQSIIHGFDRLLASRRARKLLRSALAASHRRANEDLLQSGRDVEISAGLSREQRRMAKLQKKLDMVDAAVRRGVTKRLKKGWLSTTTRVVGGSGLGGLGGGGELHREIKLVRQEWKALDDAAANDKKMGVEGRANAYEGGGGAGRSKGLSSTGGVTGRLWGLVTLTGMAWGGGVTGAQSGKEGDVDIPVKDAAEGARNNGASSDRNGKKNEVLRWSTIVGDAVDGGNVNATGGEARAVNGLAATAPIPTSSARNKRTSPAVHAVEHSAEEAQREARRRILCRERTLAREMVTHDFDAAQPPPLKCCAPGCGRIFTQKDHYLAHWTGALGHALDPPQPSSAADSSHREGATTPAPTFCDTATSIQPATPGPTTGQQQQQRQQTPAETGHPALGGEEVAAFHLAILNSADDNDKSDAKRPAAVGFSGDTATAVGFDLVSAYIRRTWGHGQAYNTLMFWRAVSSWRRHPTTKPLHVREAVTLRRLYLDPEAPRAASLPEKTRKELLRVLDRLPDDVKVDAPETTETDIDGGETFYRDTTTIERTTSSNYEATGAGGGASASVKSGVSESTAQKTRVVIGSSLSWRPGTEEASGSINRRSGTARIGIDRKVGRQTLVDKNTTAAAGIAASVATAAAAAAATAPTLGGGLRPTTFDEAQWQALMHLCRVVGPGFWVSDLGQRFTILHSKGLKRRRDAAKEIVRLERHGRLANEAAETKRQLMHARLLKEETAAEHALEKTLEEVMEAVIRSAAAGAEFLELQELETIQQEEMLAEAATVETIWIVEPPLLEDMFAREITAFCAEQAELVLMSSEDDWIPPEDRELEERKLGTAVAIALDFNTIPGGEKGAATASTTIQCAWRQRMSRVKARKLLAKVYVKRAAPGGGVYYENTLTGDSQWERPLLAYRLFPNSTW